MVCKIKEECYFHQIIIPQQNRMGEIYRERYCNGDRSICARYKVYEALGKDGVPESLYPNMEEVAAKLLQSP